MVAIVGIAATLLAYAISPGVRHAVRHAEHGVRGVVNRVFDRDQKAGARAHTPARSTPSQPRPRAQPPSR
jgi:type II secretory pathway pseudopilin PulG